MSTILKALRRLEEESNRNAGSEPAGEGAPANNSAAPGQDLRERILAEEAAAAALPPEPAPRSLRGQRVAFACAALLALLLGVGGARWLMAPGGEGALAPQEASKPAAVPAAAPPAASAIAAAPPIPQRAPIPASPSATLETAAVVPTPAAAEATQQELRRLVPPQNATPSRGLIRDRAPIRLPSSAAMPPSESARRPTATPTPQPAPTPTPIVASADAEEAPPSAEPVMRPAAAPALASSSSPAATRPSASVTTAAPKTMSKQSTPSDSSPPSRASSVPPASERVSAESKKAVMAVAEPRAKKLAESSSKKSPTVERIDDRGLPDVVVLRTSWHPSADRRSARVRIGSDGEQQTLREGDAVGGLVVQEITPSSVLFRTGDVEVRRKVGEAR